MIMPNDKAQNPNEAQISNFKCSKLKNAFGTLGFRSFGILFGFWILCFGFAAPAAAVTPIARWDVVPYQRINQGETLNVGVVAFSKNGIDRVVFNISGKGYSGGSKVATQMTHNPRTDVWEYWVPVRASEFTSDGVITIEATVYGKDGGVRSKDTDGDGLDDGLGLDPLVLHVNPTGTLPQPEAWVDVNGDDGTGQVNNSAKPFKSARRAVDAIRSWRKSNGYGDNADGGIVRLNPGTHRTTGSAGAISVVDEWVTITNNPALGGTRANTILTAANAVFDIEKAHLKGVTLDRSGGGGEIVNQCWAGNSACVIRVSVWIDHSDVIGSGRWVEMSNPVSAKIHSLYWTDSYITNVADATVKSNRLPNKLIRGVTIEHIGDDAFVNVPMIVNSTAHDLNPGQHYYDGNPTPWHSDAIQWFGGVADNNAVVYNVRVTGAAYQGLFIRGRDGAAGPSPPNAQGMAFVNVYIE